MTLVENLLRPFFRKPRRKNFLLALFDEINTNLERYYVIDQRQFITSGFEIQAWDEARQFAGNKFPREIVEYAEAVKSFNRSLEDMRVFEDHYSSSIECKTLENAKILHAKKEALENSFKSIQPMIESAQKAIRKYIDKKN